MLERDSSPIDGLEQFLDLEASRVVREQESHSPFPSPNGLVLDLRVIAGKPDRISRLREVFAHRGPSALGEMSDELEHLVERGLRRELLRRQRGDQQGSSLEGNEEHAFLRDEGATFLLCGIIDRIEEYEG